jgi:hypothetical protein
MLCGSAYGCFAGVSRMQSTRTGYYRLRKLTVVGATDVHRDLREQTRLNSRASTRQRSRIRV